MPLLIILCYRCFKNRQKEAAALKIKATASKAHENLSAGSIELTGKLSLQGKKEKGIDDYTGSYQADYENFSDTEYLFGGTSIKREAGKDISVTCTLEVFL